MKKLIYLTALTLLSSCVLCSCKKDNNTTPQPTKLSEWYLTSPKLDGIEADIIIYPTQVNKVNYGVSTLWFTTYNCTSTYFKNRYVSSVENHLYIREGNISGSTLSITNKIFNATDTTQLLSIRVDMYHSF